MSKRAAWPMRVSEEATHVGTARINREPAVAARPISVWQPAGEAVTKPSKYRNEPTIVNGIKFDSLREAARYRRLKEMEEAGLIGELQLQVSFVLAGAVIFADGTKKRALRYVADFTYVEGGAYVVEDVKGMLTDMYKVKRHLMKAILGIDIREVR
jgi:hypothetical protein